MEDYEDTYEEDDTKRIKQDLPSLAQDLLKEHFEFDAYGYATVLGQRHLWATLLSKRALYYIIIGVQHLRDGCVWVDTEEPLLKCELYSSRFEHLKRSQWLASENHKMSEYTVTQKVDL